MQLRNFVSASAVILAGWLAITFFHQVPTQRYPKLDKYPKTVGSPEIGAPQAVGGSEESAVVRVSHSR